MATNERLLHFQTICIQKLDVFFVSQYTGDQCSSYETLDTIIGNCQRLLINSGAVDRCFTLKFNIRYYRYRVRNQHRLHRYCSLCRSWCQYLASCRHQNWNWWNHCRLKFKYYEHFDITTLAAREDLPLLRIDVNLCKTIPHQPSRNRPYDKIFTINITEHKSGSANIRNGLYKLILCVI